MRNRREYGLNLGVALGVSILVGCGGGAGDPVETTSAAQISTSTASVRLQELTNSCGANQAQDFFKVVNAGTTPVPASDVSIKIWVNDTSGSDIVPRIDTGGCLLDSFGSCVHQVTGVTATPTRLPSACGPDGHHQANWEITITTTDHTPIGAGLVWSNIQLALHLANFASFSPGTGNWYSECLSSSGFADVAHAAVYVQQRLVTASSGVPPSCRAPTGGQPIPGELPVAVANGDLPLVGPLPGDTPLHVMIGLPLQNQTKLDPLIQQLYDPKSPQYRQFLTPEGFGNMFGVPQHMYDDLISFAHQNGLTVEGQYSGRTMLGVTGPASAIEQAFFVTLNQYRRPDGTIFFAPANEPSTSLTMPVIHLSGLDNFSIPRPAQGHGPDGCALHPTEKNYVGTDFRTAYGIDASVDGTGQTIGLLEYDNFVKDEPTQYAHAYLSDALPSIEVVPVPKLGGFPFAAVDVEHAREVALDIQMVMAMAPKANIKVYEWNPIKALDISSWFAQLAEDDVPIISSSWVWDPGMPNPIMSENIFKQFETQGQSFFQASMDLGAYVPGGAQPNVQAPIILSSLMTVVGGTILTTDPSGGYVSETTWNNPNDRPNPPPPTCISPPAPPPPVPLNSVTGGGFCNGYQSQTGLKTTYQPLEMPSYQVGINPFNAELTTNPPARMIPDVSLVADQIAFFGATATPLPTCGQPSIPPTESEPLQCTGGTSAATPLWAAVAALINQRSIATGGGRLGFANPTLYALAAASPASYAANFHDVKDNSNNSYSGNPSAGYHAVKGYDLATGLGTPTGNLVSTLPPQSCMPGASLTALISGFDVTAYVPNGSWDEPVNGVRVVPIEGDGPAVSIGTSRPVNTCGGNSVTGEVVCTSNDTDVYIINGTSVTKTLTSGGTAPQSFSGGQCTTCNVAIDPLHNRALLSIGTATGAALQPLDLQTRTLGTPFPVGQPETSEDIVIDAVRGLALSPSEAENGSSVAGNYQLVNTMTGEVHNFSPPGGAPGGKFDMAAEDCSTGIALSTVEFTNQLFLADLTRIDYTGATTWTAPFNFQTVSEFSGFAAGTDAIAIASPSHLGVVSGEFGSASFGAFVLPSKSGSGTPALVDWVVASLPNTPDGHEWAMGRDPHTLTAFTSPTSGLQYAVFEDDVDQLGTRTYLAVVDLQALLALPRIGGHTVAAPLVTCRDGGRLGTPAVPNCVVRYIPN